MKTAAVFCSIDGHENSLLTHAWRRGYAVTRCFVGQSGFECLLRSTDVSTLFVISGSDLRSGLSVLEFLRRFDPLASRGIQVFDQFGDTEYYPPLDMYLDGVVYTYLLTGETTSEFKTPALSLRLRELAMRRCDLDVAMAKLTMAGVPEWTQVYRIVEDVYTECMREFKTYVRGM